ncbi:MAG: LON peptidase substrate-binding domain-containing protein [Thermoanaerobaculia bacterium]|nr:LON peptidase substrate-binding domain-containing protein [Thermoanaerobaculia bacterium]
MSRPVPLPDPLPIFPLTGVILLPGNLLPLHVFEPRYRNMVEDALEEGRHIGMIQPRQPRDDDRGPPPERERDHPVLYDVGGAGRLVRCQATDEGNYAIILQGVTRFRIQEELPLRRGYRRVHADSEEFPWDGTGGSEGIDGRALLEAIATQEIDVGIELDDPDLDEVSGTALLNSLCAALPLHPAEKQALLEAPNAPARHQLLLSLLEMGLAEQEEN